MKKILIFIGLKVAEVLGFCGCVGILYGIGSFAIYMGLHFDDETKYAGWAYPILVGVILGTGVLALFAIGIPVHHFVKTNWNWADRINRRK